MRQFATGGLRIWNLSREAKLVYSFFALFSLAAIGSSILLYEDMVGGASPGAAAYYSEQTGPQAGPAAPPAAGPKIALPDEADGDPGPPTTMGHARPITVAVSYRKLLEVTHFHLFTVPVFLLIVTHLFMLCAMPPGAKVAWIVGGWLAALVHIAAPWIVRASPGAAWLFGASGALFGLTSVVLTVRPVWQMWVPRPSRGRGADSEAA